jgi:tetratricopeptide (TPR) repeat protein
LSEPEAHAELQHLIAQPPENFAQKGVRWTLEKLRKTLSWLNSLTLSGVWLHLKRAGINRKRGRLKVHSPDLEYLEKLLEVVRVLELAASSNGKIVVLFGDEFTFYRQPTLADAYFQKGSKTQPLGKLSHHSNTKGRIGGAVNALSGQVHYVLGSKCGIKQLLKLYEQVKEAYPEAEVIYLVEDNWSVHFHPTVLNAFPTQETRFELKVSHYWKNVKGEKWTKQIIPIQIVPLPTYASWSNPIEKLWRWLKQEVLHLHRRADEWDKLKEEIKKFLDQFRNKSVELLKYIGLTESSKLYGEAISLFREKPT